MTFRTVLFWGHLVAGVVGGLIILVMSATGVLLTYERQILAWAETRGMAIEPSAGQSRLPMATLVERAREESAGEVPTAVTLRSDPSAPVSMSFGPRTVRVHPYTGEILRDGAPRLRAFFRSVTDWHRWLAFEGQSRATGRAITGACNLAFLFIVASGVYLWWPRSFAWTHVRAVLLLKGGARGRARDFNWHNVFGFWSAVPLFVIVLGGVVISYPWASDVVYRVAGEAPPQRRSAAPSGRAPGLDRPPEVFVDGLDRAIGVAASLEPAWRTISVRLPSAPLLPASITVDTGMGGQPQKRATLDVDRVTGEVVGHESFASQSAGRRARSWLRFTHTGEFYGLFGQTVAGFVSLGGVVLVWTGMSLALRRFFTWRGRKVTSATAKAA